jgi:glycerol-3-phosphate acyltransferase PlsX
VNVGVDLMGGDNPPETILRALQALPRDITPIPVGLPEYRSGPLYVESSSFIEMDEPPLPALRRKKESSLCVGLRLLREKKIDAFVSSGNTGALVSGSKLILGMHHGILRPALLAVMPTKKQPVVVLDVGANVVVKASHIIQFAYLGSAYCRAQGIASQPRVGLLNIGSEAMKGTSELRHAYQQLRALAHPPFEFVGNVEGKTVFDGEVDVLLTDGFTGNIFLKTSEGIASLILDRFSHVLGPTEIQRLRPKIADLQRHLHYAEYPGALLAGVRGIVVKCHGYSTPQAFINAVIGAASLARADFTQLFYNQLDKYRK